MYYRTFELQHTLQMPQQKYFAQIVLLNHFICSVPHLCRKTHILYLIKPIQQCEEFSTKCMQTCFVDCYMLYKYCSDIFTIHRIISRNYNCTVKKNFFNNPENLLKVFFFLSLFLIAMFRICTRYLRAYFINFPWLDIYLIQLPMSSETKFISVLNII